MKAIKDKKLSVTKNIGVKTMATCVFKSWLKKLMLANLSFFVIFFYMYECKKEIKL